jgi:hypothetical protein
MYCKLKIEDLTEDEIEYINKTDGIEIDKDNPRKVWYENELDWWSFWTRNCKQVTDEELENLGL